MFEKEDILEELEDIISQFSKEFRFWLVEEFGFIKEILNSLTEVFDGKFFNQICEIFFRKEALSIYDDILTFFFGSKFKRNEE